MIAKSWWNQPSVAFDLETTGVNVETDRIVTSTVALIKPGIHTEIRNQLIAVDIDIPAGASDVHGITTEHARANGTPTVETLDLIAADLALFHRPGYPIVGCNLSYDLTLLDRELRRHKLATLDERLGRPVGPVVDVYVLDKHFDRYRPGSRKLIDLAAEYGCPLSEDAAHDATEDALAAARIAWRMGRMSQATDSELLGKYAGRKFPKNLIKGWRQFGEMSLAQLHDAQAGWYREQSEGLVTYWRQKAAQLEHEAYTAVTPEPTGEDADQILAEAGAKCEEAVELRERADGVTYVWPLAPVPVDVQTALVEGAA